MILNLKPYPAYRDSGVEWLGEVPTDWEIHRLDRLFSLRKESPVLGDPRVTGYLNGRVTLRSNVPGQKIKGVIKDAGWQRIYPGDFAISGMNAHMGGMGVSDALGQCSPIYLVLIAHLGIDPQFVSHAVREQAFSGALRALVNTIRFNSADFKREDIKKVWIALPPPFEQSAIVHFLDHADRRLHRAVRAKRQLIALLNEQKQAIIHRAVTRGLDPDVPLKDSGVEWLGEVPAHWEVKRLRSILLCIDQGVSPQAEARLAEPNVWGVLKSGCVNHGVFRDTEHKRLPDNFKIDGSMVVSVGDVLVSRACGSSKLVGSVGRVEELRYQLILSDKTFRLVFRDEKIVDFAVLVMNSSYFRIQIEQAISGAEGLAKNLPLSSLKDFRLIVPPSEEAQSIASEVRIRASELQKAIAATQREIDLLLEFRTRLIADVVTGKLDVREAAAGLPDEADEPVLFDEVEVLDENENSDKEEEADE